MILWLKLDGKFMKKLMSMPTTGNSFHLVNIHLKSGLILKKVRIFEFRVVELRSGFRSLKEEDIEAIEPSE